MFGIFFFLIISTLDPEQFFCSCIGIGSVADPGCLSRILIFTHPGSRIPDLGSRILKQQQKEGLKQLVVIPFCVSINFTKLYFMLFLKN
jgi:hypothetical protein